MNPNRLFVGNLPYQAAEGDLQELFAAAGNVTSVNMMFDKFTGKSRGFAFVELSTAEEANKAVEMFQGKDFQGRQLTVNIARPREERPQGSGPRNYGGGQDGGGYRRDNNREFRRERP
ncbi:MAG TPA: RNA-binding protein [Methylomirabilota bacterium]|nr:RNA-binding protein [Methylomirabilota bacterium]